jgi:hypothetical protein
MLSDPSEGKPNTDEAASIVANALRQLRHATPTRRPAPSCGETLHGEVGHLSVGAIVHGGHAYHLVAGVA